MATATETQYVAHRDASGSLQLVSFRLGVEEYGIEITKVQEIILLGEVTRIPQSPPHLKGLIHLRGTVIPVIDLRTRLDFSASKPTDETRVVVVELQGTVVGLIVDAVSEVMRVNKEQIVPPPASLTSGGRQYLTGLAKLEQRLLILFDIEQLLLNDLQSLNQALSTSIS